jgi:tetratricopeptide (TPR) repeat protein
MSKSLSIGLLCFSLIAFFGCSHQSKEPLQMEVAEKEMNRDPALAYHLLCNVRQEMSGADKDVAMKYKVLCIEALDKQDSMLSNYGDEIRDFVAYFDRHGDPNEKMRAYYYMGGFYRDSKKPMEALSWYQRALEAADLKSEHLDRHIISVIYAQMGEIMSNVGIDNKALEYVKKSAEYETDNIGKYEAYSMLGRDYLNIQNDSAIFYYEKAFKMAKALHVRGPMFDDMVMEQTVSFMDLGKYGNVNERLPFIKKTITKPDKAAKLYCWGKVYQYQGKSDSAEICWKEAIATNAPWQKMGSCRQLLMLKSKQGDWQSAAQYGMQYADLADSLYKLADADRMMKQNGLFDYQMLNRDLHETTRRAQVKEKWLYATVSFFTFALLFLAYEYRRKKMLAKQHAYVAYHDMKDMEARALGLQRDNESLQSLTRRVTEENERLKAELSLYRKETKEDELTRVRVHMTESSYHAECLTEEDWKQLETVVNNAYPHLTTSLRTAYPKIGDAGLRITCLGIVGVRPADVARIMGLNSSNLNRIRKRIFKNVTGRDFNDTNNYNEDLLKQMLS